MVSVLKAGALAGQKKIITQVTELLTKILLMDAEKLPHETLSKREMNVLLLLASGKTVGEIARILLLGITTVSTYRSRILAKMGMKTNAELTMYALKYKLTDM